MTLNPMLCTDKAIVDYLHYRLTNYAFADGDLYAQMGRFLNREEARHTSPERSVHQPEPRLPQRPSSRASGCRGHAAPATEEPYPALRGLRPTGRRVSQQQACGQYAGQGPAWPSVRDDRGRVPIAVTQVFGPRLSTGGPPLPDLVAPVSCWRHRRWSCFGAGAGRKPVWHDRRRGLRTLAGARGRQNPSGPDGSSVIY